MPSPAQVRVLASPQELFRAAAEYFCEIGIRAIKDRGFTVASSGGSTPRGLHQNYLQLLPIACRGRMFSFSWGDDRHVPPTDPDSNYLMANETLLSNLRISSDHIFRMPTERADADQAAQEYEQTLREFLRPADSFPRFDFILLGMGPDGHTASLFPGTKALEERQRWVIANRVEKLDTFRVTFTYAVLNNAASVTFLVSGDEKADMVRKALNDPGANLPCQKVQLENAELWWYLDKGAAVKQ